MQYDGKNKLADAVAGLYGYSPRNHNKIAELIRQAKTGLGIAGKAKVMPDEMKQDIYRWHCERLSSVQHNKQTDNNQLNLLQPVPNNVTQAIRPINDNYALPADSPIQTNKRDDAIQHVKQSTPVKLNNGDKGSSSYDYEQLHFGVTITHKGQPKRTTVMLEGYWVRALQRKHDLTDNAVIRAWIEQAIKTDGGQFDSFAPLTKQVKRMIIESFV
jgi:hypothetical protein